MKLCTNSLSDLTDLRREITKFHGAFSELGDIVDLNLDYFPDIMVVTFTKHADVIKIL